MLIDQHKGQEELIARDAILTQLTSERKHELEQILAEVMGLGKEHKAIVNRTAVNATSLATRDEMPLPDFDLLSPKHKAELGQMFAEVLAMGENN
jgi:hypothetical protein